MKRFRYMYANLRIVVVLTLLVLFNCMLTVGEIRYYDTLDWVTPTSPQFNAFDHVTVRIYNQADYRYEHKDTNSSHQVNIVNGEDFELEYECIFTHEVRFSDDIEYLIATNDANFSYYSGTLQGTSVTNVGTANYLYVYLPDYEEIVRGEPYVIVAKSTVKIWIKDHPEIFDTWEEETRYTFYYGDDGHT